jgi:hypothetical protein
LQCIQKYKEEGLVADDERQEDDDKFAYTDDDAARWLIACLGDCYPKEFVKSAKKHSTCQSTKGRWMLSTQLPCGVMLVLVLVWQLNEL